MKKFIILLLVILNCLLYFTPLVFAFSAQREESITTLLNDVEEERDKEMSQAVKRAEEILAAHEIARQAQEEKMQLINNNHHDNEWANSTKEENFLSDFYFRFPLAEAFADPFNLYLGFQPWENTKNFFANIGDKMRSFGASISDKMQYWAETRQPRFKLEYRTWIVDEALKWTTSTALTQSRLTYPNDGVIQIIGASYKAHPRLFIDFNYGIGKVSGKGTDCDWFTGTEGEISRTTHDSDGRISFYETNVYLRPLEISSPFQKWFPIQTYPSALDEVFGQIAFDIFGGYQFYRGDYRMSNGKWTSFNLVPLDDIPFALESSYRIRHKGVRAGARIIFTSRMGMSLTIRSAYLPWLESKGYGWWNNRILNFVQSGGRGRGYDGEVYVNYAPEKLPGLTLGVGYRYMRLVNRGGLSHSDEEGIAPWDMNWDVAKSALRGGFFDLSYKF